MKRTANDEYMRKVACAVLAVLALSVVAAFPHSGGARPLTAHPCDRETVIDLVKTFVRAYNQDDQVTLDHVWAAEPDFEWYSVSPRERVRADAYDRDTLLSYFSDRHQLNDRLRLKRLRVRIWDDGTIGIGYRLQRKSDQANARGLYHGKASAKEVTLQNTGFASTSRCALFVWSMGKAT